MKFSIITPTYNQLANMDRILAALKVQTCQDFEWIIAIDGEGEDGTKEWAQTHGIQSTSHKKEGFEYAKTVNEAARVAKGEFLVIINGDSFPKQNFLEVINRIVEEGSIYSTIRENVDHEGKVISPDWRIDRTIFPSEGQESMQIFTPHPWTALTGNGLVVSKRVFDALGGFFEGYKGGREDWDFFMRAHFEDVPLCVLPQAVIYHIYHGETTDTPENLALFGQRYQELLDQKEDRVQEKMDQIMSPARAEAKKKVIQTKLEEVKKNEQETV